MLNEYGCTRDNRWTQGRPNTEVPHEERTPMYFVRASSEAEARTKIQARFPDDTSFTIVLTRENVNPILDPEKGDKECVAA